MAPDSILQRLDAEFDSPPESIRAVVALAEAGAPAEFIARYRRDECGDLGPARTRELVDRFRFLDELERRKEGILQRLQAAKEPLDLGDVSVADCFDREVLDDIDRAVRPNDKNMRSKAAGYGLKEFCDKLHRHDLGDEAPDTAAAALASEERGLPDGQAVMEIAVRALAERYGEDPILRRRVRDELSRGVLTARAKAPGEKKGKKKKRGKAAPAPAAAATAEPTAAETQAAEAPTAESPVAESPAVDTPAVETQATEVAQTEAAATGEAAASDSQTAEAPPADEAAASEAPAAEAPKAEEPKVTEVAPPAEQPAAEEPAGASATADSATADSATTDSAITDQAPADKPNADKAPGKGRGGKGSKRYEEFFDFREPVRRIPAQRMLALRKAEREGIIEVRLELEPGRELELFRARFSPDVDPATPLGVFLDAVYAYSYAIHVHGSCEGIVRHDIKENADRETVLLFGRALRSQLMGPGVGPKPALAIRSSAKSVWIASLKADGSLGPRHTLGIGKESDREQVAKVIAETIAELEPVAIGVPHGRGEAGARRHAEAGIAAYEGENKPAIFAIDETAAMVYASGATARRKMPGADTGMRATIALVRRLVDPLRELIRIEPRGLGLGNTLAEVHQGLLTRMLESVSSECISRVGVDVNRGDTDYLALVPGLSRDQARAIVEHRSKNGPFASLADVAALEAIDAATFAHVGGFLRIRGGSQPLDATSIHPADYEVVEAIASIKGCEIPALFGQGHREVQLDALTASTGRQRLRLLDILQDLTRYGQDPRGTLQPVVNQGIATIDDLRVDLEVQGRITNLTDFGAFVDLGVGTDGLVHISQIPGSRIRNPEQMLRVGEVISVFVVSIDKGGKRIGLSMHRPRHVADGRLATIGERLAPNNRRGRGRGRGPRGDDRDSAPASRAARAPEGRRGDRRGGPKEPRKEAGDGPSALFGGGRGRGGPGGRGGRGGPGGGRGRDDRGRGGRGGAPRIHTIESEREQTEQRGHKGELTSLSSLANLLGGGDKSKGKPDSPAKQGADAQPSGKQAKGKQPNGSDTPQQPAKDNSDPAQSGATTPPAPPVSTEAKPPSPPPAEA